MMFDERSKKMAKLSQTTIVSILFVALAWSFTAQARAQCGELTWLKAIQEALDANQALAAARQALDAQHKEVAITRAEMLPRLTGGGSGLISSGATFSASAGVIPEKTTQAAGLLQQTLYNQASIDALGAQKYLYESQRNDYEATRAQTIAGAGQDYVGVLLAEALLAVRQQNVELTEESLEITKSQEEAGAVLFRDVLRWQSQLYADQQGVVTQESAVLITRFKLNQTRNRPAEEVCVLEDLSVERNGFIFASPAVFEITSDDAKATVLRDYLVELGIDRSPEIRGLDAEIRSQERSMKSARRWLIPSLDASLAGAVFLKTSGGGSDVQTGGDTFWQAQGLLTWNILDGGAFIAGMNLEKALLYSLKSQLTEAATALEETIRGTVAIAIASFENIGLSGLQIETATKNYELVNEAYLEGDANFLELLDSQQQRLAAEKAAKLALYGFLSDLLTVEQSINYFPFLEADADARIRELEARLRE
jgi:outer membrane protein TolC